LDWLRFRRIKGQMLHAAKKGEIFHLWWHPHNFGMHTKENLAFLTKILEYYAKLQEKYEMQSLNMEEIARMRISSEKQV
jgi:hypothetical protein